MATWRIPLPLSQVRRASKSAVKVLKVRSSLPSGVITQATTVALWISSPAHRSWITSISPPCTEWVWRPDEQRLWYACSPEIGWHNSWCLWAAKVTLRNRLAVRRAVDLLAPLHFHASWCRTAAWLATRGKRIRRGSAYAGEAHTRGKRIRGGGIYEREGTYIDACAFGCRLPLRSRAVLQEDGRFPAFHVLADECANGVDGLLRLGDVAGEALEDVP